MAMFRAKWRRPQAVMLAVSIAWAAIATTPTARAFSTAPVAAERSMVVSAQHLATQVGVDVLKRGGNAIDAAVAVGYALAVVYPSAGNLGRVDGFDDDEAESEGDE